MRLCELLCGSSARIDRQSFDALMRDTTLQQLLPGCALQAGCINLLSRLMIERAARDDVMITDAFSLQDEEAKIIAALQSSVML